MKNIEKPDPLLEWNRLNKENAEQAFTSALFSSMAHTAPIVDKFSMWLLAGTGASGALLISQIQSVLPHLSVYGFKLCLIFLVISAVFGFMAKHRALLCQIQSETIDELLDRMPSIFSEHEKDEEEIQEHAKQRGINLKTEIDFSNVVSEFVRPFPFWARWLVQHQTKKTQGDRQAGYHVAIKAYFYQSLYTTLQSVSFLAFLCTAAWYARAI